MKCRSSRRGKPRRMATQKKVALQPIVNPRLKILKNLVTNYVLRTHKAQFLPAGHDRYSWHKKFQYLQPAAWTNVQNMPYVTATNLVDAYSHLPSRPDLAFNALWSAINTSYNDLFLSSHLTHGAVLTDSKSIEYSVLRISQKLQHQIAIGASSVTIDELIRAYLDQAPDRNFNFVASFVLKGIAVELHNAAQTQQATKVREVLVPPAYFSFKKNFPALYSQIKNSSGAKYALLCTIVEATSRTDVEFGIKKSSEHKARALVHVTGKLLRQAVLSYNGTPSSGTFDNEKHWLSFLILTLLYATRNTAAHGNSAVRLNSIFSSADSVTASSWTFLFGYCYLSLILLCQGNVALTDLPPIYENSKIIQ